MKNYPHIMAKLYREPWLILPDYHRAICRALDAHIAGEPAALGINGPMPLETGVEAIESIAVIPVHGIIGKHLSALETMCGGCDLDDVKAEISEAIEADEIESLVLDIRSPGGTTTGVFELSNFIRECTEIKDIVSYSDSEMCSAAYAIGSQCTEIFCAPSAQLGSVGVWMALLDQTAALEAAGMKVNEISAGEWKTAGAPWRVLSPDERAMFQARVDKIHSEFIELIQGTREISDSLLQGQVLDGEEAVEAGFVDGNCDDLDDLLDILQERAS